MNTGEFPRSNIREVLQLFVENHKLVRPTYLSLYEESLVVSSAEIEGAHGLPMDTATVAAELQCVVS